MNSKYEVVQDAIPEYMPLSRIMGYCYTMRCSNLEFLKRKKNGDLPRTVPDDLILFSRFKFNSRTNRMIGPRTLEPANICS